MGAGFRSRTQAKTHCRRRDTFGKSQLFHLKCVLLSFVQKPFFPPSWKLSMGERISFPGSCCGSKRWRFHIQTPPKAFAFITPLPPSHTVIQSLLVIQF